MYLRQILFTASVFAPLALAAPGESADGHQHDHEIRQHGAHVHGIAALNLAIEGREVHIELDSPAANIVGFEHAPSSEADHAALDKAVALLEDGNRLFRFNNEAGCRLENADVASELLHGADEGHAEENHEHEHEGHSDMEATYHFECDRPGELTQLSVELFEAFAGTHKLEVQYVINSKQGAAELTAGSHVVEF